MFENTCKLLLENKRKVKAVMWIYAMSLCAYYIWVIWRLVNYSAAFFPGVIVLLIVSTPYFAMMLLTFSDTYLELKEQREAENDD